MRTSRITRSTSASESLPRLRSCSKISSSRCVRFSNTVFGPFPRKFEYNMILHYRQQAQPWILAVKPGKVKGHLGTSRRSTFSEVVTWYHVTKPHPECFSFACYCGEESSPPGIRFFFFTTQQPVENNFIRRRRESTPCQKWHWSQIAP